MRVRITIEPCVWKRACAYASATHRTPSELVAEALEQIQARYPKCPKSIETDLDVLAAKVAEKLALRVPAGTLEAKIDG